MNKQKLESILWDTAAIGFGLIIGVFIIALMNQINLYFYPIDDTIVSSSTDPLEIAFQDSIFLTGRLISISAGSFFAGAFSVWVRSELSYTSGIIIACVLLLVGIIDLTLFPLPLWFIITSVISYIPMVLSGNLFVRKFIHSQ